MKNYTSSLEEKIFVTFQKILYILKQNEFYLLLNIFKLNINEILISQVFNLIKYFYKH